QEIFQTTQEQVCLTQGLRVPLWQEMELLNRRQRRKQRAGLQRRLATTADKLEDLDNKLDFTNATRAELNVIFQPTTAYLTGDHPFHVTQGLDHAEVDIATEHKRAQHGA